MLASDAFQFNWLAVMLFEFCFTTKRSNEITAYDGIEGGEAIKIYHVLQAYHLVCEANPNLRKSIITLRPTLLSLSRLPGSKLIISSYKLIITSLNEWFLDGDKQIAHSREFIAFIKSFS